MSVAYCTLAIHAPYRRRARVLCADLADAPWVVFTDEPADFAGLAVRAVRHAPTGPMAVDYLARLPPTGEGRGAAAYHDKRFALHAALGDFETGIFLDADSRVAAPPRLAAFPPGLAVLPRVPETVAEHLERFGPWRRPIFAALARELLGDETALERAHWCYENCFAVTRDGGREARFFEAWGRAAAWLQEREVFSGEGGVLGLAAACAGWSLDYWALAGMAFVLRHEAGGPKAS